MKNIALLIEYDGTCYAGWQYQPNAITIQEMLEKALSLAYKQSISIIGAGRTDAGVHAAGQVANFHVNEPYIPLSKISEAVNSKLPLDIRILAAAEVPEDFNSRFSATAREYVYNLCLNYSVFNARFSSYSKFILKTEKLFESAELFLGEHNFTPFSKVNPDTKSYLCNVEKCEWKQINDTQFQLLIKADRFVYGMVRTIVGTMIDVARGKKSLSSINESFIANNRTNISPLANANGLILNKIYFPNNIFSIVN